MYLGPIKEIKKKELMELQLFFLQVIYVILSYNNLIILDS